MRHEHRDIQSWIAQRYESRFKVAVEVTAQNRLPDHKSHWYQPDVILRGLKGQIRYIIEVENDPTRKSIVGACILADASIKALGQSVKPKLIFVVYSSEGIRQIANFVAKVEIVKPYCKCLGSINVHAVEDFKRLEL